jgi:hypothetical protein
MKITCGGARGKGRVRRRRRRADESFSVIEILARSLRCATRGAKKWRFGRAVRLGAVGWYGGSERGT